MILMAGLNQYGLQVFDRQQIMCRMLLFGFDETDITLSERAVAVVDIGGQFVRRKLYHLVCRFVSCKDFLIADGSG